MISATLTGNLGNHMWIYAIARFVAESNNYKWGFNPVPEYDYYAGKPQMDFMNIDYGEKQTYRYSETPSWQKQVWSEKFSSIVYENGDRVDYHPFQKDIFDIADDTRLFIRCCQDARYLSRSYILKNKWFEIKEEKKDEYDKQIARLGFSLDNNTAIINVRGGEYKNISNLILPADYWRNAMDVMRKQKPKIRFIAVSDDVEYANRVLDFKIPVIHLSVGGDYYILNNAKNIILSNSSFGIFPTWLNENNPLVIAPYGWARYNVTNGYWANSDIWTFPWLFINRQGQAPLHRSDSYLEEHYESI